MPPSLFTSPLLLLSLQIVGAPYIPLALCEVEVFGYRGASELAGPAVVGSAQRWGGSPTASFLHRWPPARPPLPAHQRSCVHPASAGRINTSGENIALFKGTVQSSAIVNGDSLFAVDGNIDGVFGDGSVSYTDTFDAFPYWCAAAGGLISPYLSGCTV